MFLHKVMGTCKSIFMFFSNTLICTASRSMPQQGNTLLPLFRLASIDIEYFEQPSLHDAMGYDTAFDDIYITHDFGSQIYLIIYHIAQRAQKVLSKYE